MREVFMLGNLNPQQLSFFIIFIVSFAVLITEPLRNDRVALFIVLALFVTGVLDSHESLSGFSSEPAIVAVGIFVLSAVITTPDLPTASAVG